MQVEHNKGGRPRKEFHTGDMNIAQKDDINIDGDIARGESMVDVVGEKALNSSRLAELAFMEEPVTIRIEENSRSENPETHVATYVQGRGSEVLNDGKWLELGWLPIGVPLITKRKYVEVLARAKTDTIKTQHDDATVERPRNTVQRRTSSNYPISIIQDNNPRGHEWLSRIMMGH
jgi:hypothetical protein